MEYILWLAILKTCTPNRPFRNVRVYIEGSEVYYAATVVTTAQFSGVLIGTIAWGSAADRFGRRPILIAIYGLTLISCIGTSASFNWQTLAAFRLLNGFCCGGITTAGFSYIMEHMPADFRLPLRAFVNWGWTRLCMALICWLCMEWRMAQLAVGLASATPCLLLLLFVLPESAQWLGSRHRYLDMRHAEKTVEKINQFGSKVARYPNIKEDHLKPSDRSDECEKLNTDEIIGTRKSDSNRTYTVKDLFATRALTKLTLVLWIMWFVASLSSWPIDLVSATLPGNLFVNQILFAVIIGLSKKVMFLTDRYVPQFNRRLLHQVPCGVVIVTFAVVTILYHVQTPWAGTAITSLCIFGVMFLEYTWDACYLCSAEGFPTVVRGTGMGTGSLCARVAALLAPQISYMAAYWPALPYCTVVVATMVSITFSLLLLPDTKGLELPVELDEVKEE